MGKKSKRNRGGGGGNSNKQEEENVHRRLPPNQRPKEEVETIENLKFQDPYVDEYIVEDAVVEEDAAAKEEDDVHDDGDTKMNDTTTTTTTTTTTKNIASSGEEIIQSWHPLMGENIDGVELEMDPTAYKMYHTLSPEWPSLSFDFCKDSLGDCRSRFPHSVQAVIGTQATQPSDNQLSVIKLSDLGKLPQDKDDDEDEFDLNDEDSDDDSDSDDDDDFDLDPVLEHYTIPHYGGVNRIRTMPQNSNIVASWSDVGNVYLFDIKDLRSRFLVDGNGNNKKPSQATTQNKHQKPIVTYSDHGIEGYAMDWSNVTLGQLATGDNNGNIHLWKPSESGSSGDYSTVKAYSSSSQSNNVSIEDIQWSPTESTVFAAAESFDSNSNGGGHVSIYDIRAPNKSMLRPNLSNTDINVLSWNTLVSNLLATGDDNGTLSVWDLRHFQSSDKSNKNKPLARFTCHKTPITSVEWHPTDESMLAVSDTVGAYVYDLSVEEDTAPPTPSGGGGGESSNNITNLVADIPPQLLFCHSGSNDFKELHWHPQISSCIMTTAYSGFSIFIPSNL